MDQLTSQIAEAAIALAGTALVWLAASARRWFQQKVENEYVQQMLLRLTSAVEVGVREAAVNLVPKIRDAAADGKITSEEAQLIRKDVRNAAIGQLTKVDLKRLDELFDRSTLANKLDGMIEAQLHKLKERAQEK